jgi:hypothetical protein
MTTKRKPRKTYEERVRLSARRLREGGEKINRVLLEGVVNDGQHDEDLQLAQGIAQMAQGFGGLLLGAWLELHRIADALEEANKKGT